MKPVDEVGRWADSLPGDFAVDVTEYDDRLTIEVIGTLLSSGLFLRAVLVLDLAMAVPQYRFHVQHAGGRLLWRRDRHPGHEHERGMRGPEDVHRVRHGKEVRHPSDPVDLASVRSEIISSNLEYT